MLPLRLKLFRDCDEPSVAELVVVDVTTAIFFKPALEITQEAVAAYDKTYPSK